MNVFVSIVVPLYNKENTIKKTIDSILNQTYKNFELIIVDDGSTDKSVDIVKSYNSPKIRLYQKQNGGPSAARNYGVNKSYGDWIIFIDADDVFYPNSISYLIEPINSNNKLDIVCGKFNIIFGTSIRPSNYSNFCGIVPNNKKDKWVFYEKCLPRTGTAIIRKSILLKYPFDECLRRFEDLSVIYKWVKDSNIYIIPQIVFDYHYDQGCASKPLKDYNLDYIFHMDFSSATFWEKCSLGRLYSEGLRCYPNKASELKLMYLKWNRFRFYNMIIILVRKPINFINRFRYYHCNNK